MFNFAATPLAPPGTKVVAHIKSTVRRTWELNGEVGWYVGPSMLHYRCVKCYFPRTRTVRDCDTVTFFPTSIPFPEINLTDHLKQAAGDIISILTQPPSTTTPSLAAGDPVRNALLTLATQLKRVQPIPEISTDIQASPRVDTPALSTHTSPHETSPRVGNNKIAYTPTSVLQRHSKVSKNARFNNSVSHRYPLRSKLKNNQRNGTNFRHLASRQLLAQHTFHF